MKEQKERTENAQNALGTGERARYGSNGLGRPGGSVSRLRLQFHRGIFLSDREGEEVPVLPTTAIQAPRMGRDSGFR